MTPVYKKGDKLRALFLTPTRELAMHIHLVVAAKHIGVRVAVVVGGLIIQFVQNIHRMLNQVPPCTTTWRGRTASSQTTRPSRPSSRSLGLSLNLRRPPCPASIVRTRPACCS